MNTQNQPTASHSKHKLLKGILHGVALLISAVLGWYLISKSGYSNSYYAAAVRSMMQSFHNFFFVSYDPAGFITVDKPPLALWLQTISAMIFGFKGWALLLPSIIAQILSVELVYSMVKKTAGDWAGIIAAFLLALSPISVLLSATNETDPVLILLMILSGWALLKAIEKNKFKYLILSAVFVGLAFNTKMMQAYIVLPAFGLTYFFLSKASWKKRIGQLTVATVLLLAISFAWILTVDAIPASQRPYIGSTTDNSELSLATGYNGLQRILGQKSGFMLGTKGTAETARTSATARRTRATAAGASSSASTNQGVAQGTIQMQPPGQGTFAGNGAIEGGRGFPGVGPADGGGGFGGLGGGAGGMFGGKASAFRLWESTLGGQIGWYLALALVGIVVIFSKKSEGEEDQEKLEQKAAGMFWGLWLVAGGTVFSVAQFMHPYYTATIAPPIAALAAIGIVMSVRYYVEGTWRKWLLPLGIIAAAAGQWVILSAFSGYGGLKVGVSVVMLIAAILLIIPISFKIFVHKRIVYMLVVVASIAMVITPCVWIRYSLVHNVNSTIPSAGPTGTGGGLGGGARGGANRTQDRRGATGLGRKSAIEGSSTLANRAGFSGNFAGGTGVTGAGGFGGNGGFGMGGFEGGMNMGGVGAGMFGSSTVNANLLAFLEQNQGTAKYMVATENSHVSDGMIINSGRAVMAWGGFSGTDPAITLDAFKQDVQDGQVRYVYLSDARAAGPGMAQNGAQNAGQNVAGNVSQGTTVATKTMGSGLTTISTWVSSTCQAVSGFTDLYDCQGATSAAASGIVSTSTTGR